MGIMGTFLHDYMGNAGFIPSTVESSNPKLKNPKPQNPKP